MHDRHIILYILASKVAAKFVHICQSGTTLDPLIKIESRFYAPSWRLAHLLLSRVFPCLGHARYTTEPGRYVSKHEYRLTSS